MASFYFDGNKFRIYEVPTNSTYTLSLDGYRIYTPTDSGESLVRFDVQRDLWSRFQDWVSINSWSYVAFNRTGGGFRGFDELNNAVYQTNDFRLLTSEGWRIVLANYPHEVIFKGNLFTDDASSLFDNARLTAQGIVPRIEGFDSLQTYQVSGSSSGTGGATAAQVWQNPSRSLTDKAGFSLTLAERQAIAAIVKAQLAEDFATISASVDPQMVRDAMKLSPSPGVAESDSIDAVLNLTKDQASIAALNSQT